jgi:hypothetical protein
VRAIEIGVAVALDLTIALRCGRALVCARRGAIRHWPEDLELAIPRVADHAPELT